MIDTFGRAVERLVDGLTAVAGVLVVLMLGLVNVEVAGRYLFGTSTLVADEYAAYLFVWVTLLGAAYTLREERHLRVGAAVDRLPAPVRRAAALGAAVLGLAVSAVALYATLIVVGTSWRMRTVSIQPSATPLVWPQLVLPFGFSVLCLAYLDEIVRRATGRRSVSETAGTSGLDL